MENLLQNKKNIYDIVLTVNLQVQNNAKPGASWTDIHLLAERINTIEGLQNLGLLSQTHNDDDMLNYRVVEYYFRTFNWT